MNELILLLLVIVAIAIWRQGRRLDRLERHLATVAPVAPLPNVPNPEPVPEAEPPPVRHVEPIAVAEAVEAAPAKPGFEERLTQNWFVWVGGIVLALGALFLVRAAADAGIFGPRLRLAMAGLGGLVAVISAEWLVRRTAVERLNPFVPSALAAAGCAAMFATLWAAGTLYNFIEPFSAFLLMALIALLTLALALRYGQFLAWLGLGGALFVPWATGMHSHADELFINLTILFAAAFLLLRLRPWRGFLWALIPAILADPLLVILTGFESGGSYDLGQVAPVGWYLLAIGTLGLALPTEAPTRWLWRVVLQSVLALLWLLLLSSSDYPMHFCALFLVAILAHLGVGCWRNFEPSTVLVMPIAGLVLLLTIDMGAMEWRAFDQVTSAPDLWNAAQAFWRPQDMDRFSTLSWALALVLCGSGFLAIWRARQKGLWAVIAAFGPLLIIAIAYLRLGGLAQMAQPLALLALVIGIVAVLLAGVCQRFGTAWRGVVAALALATLAALALIAAMLLSQAWLPIALALLALAAVWLWNQLAIGALILSAPWLAWSAALLALMDPALTDHLGAAGQVDLTTILISTLLPAGALAFAARQMRFRAVLQRVSSRLELAALVFLMLAIGHTSSWLAAGTNSPALVEAGLRTAAWLTTLAWLIAYSRESRLFWPATLGHLALLWWISLPPLLVEQNPSFTGLNVGNWPLINLLLPAYGLPAAALILLAWVLQKAALMDRVWRPVAWLTAVLALLGGLAYPALEIRRTFHDGVLTGPWLEAELYAYSLWLLVAAAILSVLSISRAQVTLRWAGIAILTVALGKLFVIDLAHLSGLLRAFAFLGLGMSLIAVGYAFRRWAAPAVADGRG